MSTMDNVLVFKMECPPAELPCYAIEFVLELLLPKQSADLRYRVLGLKRINETIDERAAQWMVHDGFKQIPPGVEFMLFPKNNFAERWMDKLAMIWNDVQRYCWFDEPHIPS